MRRRSALPAIFAVAVVASLVFGPAAPAGRDHLPPARWCSSTSRSRRRSGAGGSTTTSVTGLVTNNIWYGGQIYDNKPSPAAALRGQAEARQDGRRPSPSGTRLRRLERRRPVTCEDWKATWRVFVNPQFNVVSREGWKDVQSVTCKGKSGTIVFARPFAAWERWPPVASTPLTSSGAGHQPDVQRLDPGLERPVEVPELAEAACSSRSSRTPGSGPGPP